MQQVADLVSRHLDNRDTRFIFPSEVAAAFWRRYSLSLTDRRAVRADRFLSWDTFKEETFVRRRDAAPANSFVRICFAADALSRNARGGTFFEALVLPACAESWEPFVRPVARMLPSLEGLLSDRRAGRLLNPGLRKDLEKLARLYREFLHSHGLFEPLHEPARDVTQKKSIVFFPDVILDFPEYDRFLDKALTTAVHSPPAKATALVSFPNARIEVKQACIRCRELLDTGAVPASIAVTLADWDGYWEEFRDTAARYDIPLLRRAGKPLSDYTEVRLYSLLAECVSSGFQVTALKELFMNAAYPWKEVRLGRELVRFGIDNYGIQNSPRSKGVDDEWLRRLKFAATAELAAF